MGEDTFPRAITVSQPGLQLLALLEKLHEEQLREAAGTRPCEPLPSDEKKKILKNEPPADARLCP